VNARAKGTVAAGVGAYALAALIFGVHRIAEPKALSAAKVLMLEWFTAIMVVQSATIIS